MKDIKEILKFLREVPIMMGMLNMPVEKVDFVGSIREILYEWKGYKDLEKQGKLLKLPCAVGDTVYEVQESRKRIQPYIVIAVHVSDCGNLYGWELKDGKGVYSNVNGFSEYALGKSVFIAREEAEAALEDKKSGDKE